MPFDLWRFVGSGVGDVADELTHKPFARSAVIRVSVDRAEEVEPDLIPAEDEPEVVQERWDNRALKVERHMARDSHGDYKNHGPWAMWDDQGQVIGFGAYHNGARQGKWVRYFIAGEATVLKSPMLRNFERLSRARANSLAASWTANCS